MVQFAMAPREEVEAVNRKLVEEHRAQLRAALGTRPPFVNAEEASAIDEPTLFAYRGLAFYAKPVSYPMGLRLNALLLRLEQARPRLADGDSPEATLAEVSRSMAEAESAYGEAVRLYARLAYRARGWRRWLRAVLPNPFRQATEAEIGELLDFFWKCRTGRSIKQSQQAGQSGARKST